MNLAEFLDANKNDIIEYVGKIVRTVPTSPDVFSKLVELLRLEFPIEKNGDQFVVDKVHVELAWAILEAMWLGCLAQQKAKRRIYPENCPAILKDMIDVAFETGRKYGETRP